MTNPMITIYDCETNETEIREMNAEEYKDWQTRQEAKATEIVAQADKEAARQAVLTKLGITADDLTSLGL